MKEGDLIKVESCQEDPRGLPCQCFLCVTDSSRMGIVLEAFEQPARYHGLVLFDNGKYALHYYCDVKVIVE